MKKLLFFPLILLVLFTVTSCNDDDDDTPAPVFTETEQMIFGNWKMHSFNEDYYDDNGDVVHNISQDNLNNLFEYQEDGTFRFKGEEDENWSNGKFVIEETGGEKKFVVLPASGNRAEATTIYTIETLTATEMVLIDAYDYAPYNDENGNEVISRRVVNTYNFQKL